MRATRFSFDAEGRDDIARYRREYRQNDGMGETVDFLLLRTWWRYADAGDPLFREAYHYFNLLEGLAWLVFGGAVFARYLREGKSWIEIAYAATFVAFGATDFREAWALESWLIWIKAALLAALLLLRNRVLRAFYPGRRLF